MKSEYGAVVIGGGFYGAAVAQYLVEKRRFGAVLLVEKNSGPLLRASYRNQARIHNGYHYPRSYTTASRSRVNMKRFMDDYSESVKSDFGMVYAIAGINSKVSPRQFERFCAEIGAKLAPAPQSIREYFDKRLVKELYYAEEFAFDAEKLAALMMERLKSAGVECLFSRSVTAIIKVAGGLEAVIEDQEGGRSAVMAKYVFNCAYSGLNQIGGEMSPTATGLKHEVTEMALMRPPQFMESLGVTVMDGPFFSMMPFPPRGLHTLSHVRYTPHFYWMDSQGKDPYARLDEYGPQSHADRMVRDVARFMPAIMDAEYRDSIFEVKTVLAKNEVDDGRPILFERNKALPNVYSILGGKIDNVYDILEKLDAEPL